MKNDGRSVEEESDESGDTERYEGETSQDVCQDECECRCHLLRL